MAAAVERLAQEALSLSDQERAELARKLLVSLEGPPDEDVTDAWDREIATRVDRIREGTAKGRPAEEVSRARCADWVCVLALWALELSGPAKADR